MKLPPPPVRPFPRGIILPAALVALYAVAVSRLPLLDYLGYEFSAAVALLYPLVPGLFFVRWMRGADDDPGAWGRTIVLATISLVAPLAVGLLNGLFVKNCAPGEGLAWFGLTAGVGLVWVGGLAYFCASAFRRPISWYLVLLALVLLHPLLLGYFTPRVDSYNVVYGYFPGFTYDEELRIGQILVVWNAVRLAFALALISAGAIIGRRGRPGTKLAVRVSFYLLLALLGMSWYYRTDLGFETTTSSLRASLGSRVVTRHFRIYYDSASISGDEIRWVAAEHEFRYFQVARFLGTDTTRVIESYMYPGTETKRRLIGAGNTDIAKPWRGEIHLDGDSWRNTLKHELTHALAAEFGMPVIRANVNIGLVEGLAMASGPSFGNRTLQEYAASMIRFGVVDDPGALIRPAGFAFQSSTVSYVLMGAFCEWLIGGRGMNAFKTWYGGGSPVDAYGVGVDSLVAEWRASLDGIDVPESWKSHTDFYFRRKSIFARECARVVANLNADGGRALDREEYGSAVWSFGEALSKSWNASSFAGLARTFFGRGDYDGVIMLFDAERGDSTRSGSLAGIRMIYGDALMMRGEFSAALAVYRELRDLDLSPGLNEALALRMQVAGETGLREYLAPVIAGTMEDSVALDWLSGIENSGNAALISHLKGKLMLAKGDYAGAARETAEYFAPFQYPELNGALNDITAGAFFRLGSFFSARAFYERTLDYNPGAVLTGRVRDRQERCDWFEREWGRMFPAAPVVP